MDSVTRLDIAWKVYSEYLEDIAIAEKPPYRNYAEWLHFQYEEARKIQRYEEARKSQ